MSRRVSGPPPDMPEGFDPAVIEVLAELRGVRRSDPRRTAGRARVMAAAASARQRAATTRWARWRRRVVVGAFVFGGANLALSGVVALAAGAQPDSILYGVKRAAEAAKLSLTFDPVDKARLELQLAERRAEEAQAMARSGHAGLALDAARDATTLVEEARATFAGNPSVANEQALAHASSEARARLEEVFAALENGTDPGAAEAARSLDATWSGGLAGAHGAGAATPTPGAGGAAGSAGGAGAGSPGAGGPGVGGGAAAGHAGAAHPTGRPTGH